MKNLKKKKKAGPNIFNEIFLHEVIDITISVTDKANHKFIVRGMLIDHDEKYYYIGDIEDGVRVAVAKTKVLVVELYDDVEDNRALDLFSKPDGNEGH